MTKEEILEKSRNENKNTIDPATADMLSKAASLATGCMTFVIFLLEAVEIATGNLESAIPLFLAYITWGVLSSGFLAFKSDRKLFKVLFPIMLFCWLVFAGLYVFIVLKRCGIIS